MAWGFFYPLRDKRGMVRSNRHACGSASGCPSGPAQRLRRLPNGAQEGAAHPAGVAKTRGCAGPGADCEEEAEATIRALQPPKRTRPLIAIIGINDATETTDDLMPHGILRRADVADVVALARPRAGDAVSGTQG